MKGLLFLVVLAVSYCTVMSTISNPKVQVYSSDPGAYGESNTLICHVSGFHPPDIQIQLLRNSVELPNANQTDLAFNKGWHFHLTRHAAFTPARGEDYVCKVTHGTSVKNYAWEPNM